MIILGTNSIKDTGYDVANSCRFNDGSSDYLQWNSSPAGNRQKFTFSVWLKRSSLGTSMIASSSYSSSDEGYFFFDSNDKLTWQTSATGMGDLKTNRVFRDLSAWYHIVLSVDTTQSTATSRMRLYINGSEYTWDGNTTQPDQNKQIYWNVGGTYYPYIGRRHDGNYFDGYMAEIVHIDDQQLDATSFGEFDSDTGIWKPIDVSELTFGTTGYYLDFEDSSALGNDVSGNGNDFTVNNLTAIDQSTDTCTNNFATWNPLAKYLNMLTLSEGNTKAISAATNNPWYSARATIGFTSGKWFWETKFTGSTNPVPVYIGVVDESARMNIEAISENGTTMYYNGSGGEMRVDGTNTSNDYGNFSTSDICGIAINADDNLITIYKNGSAIVTNYALSTTRTGFLFPVIMATNTSDGTNSNGVITNFGSPPYSESGGETDGNGYGNFAHAVPSGYYSLNTKNLSEFG